MGGFWWGIGFCTDCSVYLGLGWFGWVVDCELVVVGFGYVGLGYYVTWNCSSWWFGFGDFPSICVL